MSVEIDQDCLLGYPIKPQNLRPRLSDTIEYYEVNTGTVKVTSVAYQELRTGSFERYIIAGITRNAYENKLEPPLITPEFIREGYKTFVPLPPLNFKEKSHRFLKYIYEHGGSENVKFEFNSIKDHPLAYANEEEFIRIVEFLDKEHFIRIGNTHLRSAQGSKIFSGVQLTSFGTREIEKELPKIPMIGLVDQRITTGVKDIDDEINNAKDLFFQKPQTLERMRNACETLSYVLEPLRSDLESYFSKSDVSDFFQIVNRFDIRHNKAGTINLIHEEQLEWVFYTLLNTINVYTKLKTKGV